MDGAPTAKPTQSTANCQTNAIHCTSIISLSLSLSLSLSEFFIINQSIGNITNVCNSTNTPFLISSFILCTSCFSCVAAVKAHVNGGTQRTPAPSKTSVSYKP
ncbi:hypothetical protein CMV_000687 [Castanea mollissima]|uniref:Uncharacterized protein n=1 Tax=Castanea mollissima TaxID=60419 RepID=A0A8J4RYT8_9ROSI|nr:hypothetical protein CMV_000687 [Castanea mollissima]